VPEGDDAKGLIVFELVFDGDAIRGSASGNDGENKMTAKVDLKRTT
jgi:hypothetical protein